MEVIIWGVGREGLVPDKKHELQERTELGRPEVSHALGALAGPEAEVKAQLEQVGNMAGSLGWRWRIPQPLWTGQC